MDMPEAMNGHVAMTVKEMLAEHSRTLEQHGETLNKIGHVLNNIETRFEDMPSTMTMLDQRVDHLESRWDRTFGVLMAVGAVITALNIALIVFNVFLGAFR